MTQKEKLLLLFSDGKFHNNYSLNKICFRYGARLHEMSKKGYIFEKKHDGGTMWSWRLIGKADEVRQGEML